MKVPLQGGAVFDILNQQELEDSLRKQAVETYMEYARGMKYLRFGPVGIGTPTGGVLSFDGSSVAGLGPRTGYIWTIRRMSVEGLATGTSPDLLNIYRSAPEGPRVWQLNGNNFAYTFSKTELLLLPGETLSFAGTGLTSTSQIQVGGDLLQVPAEQIYKLF